MSRTQICKKKGGWFQGRFSSHNVDVGNVLEMPGNLESTLERPLIRGGIWAVIGISLLYNLPRLVNLTQGFTDGSDAVVNDPALAVHFAGAFESAGHGVT